MVSQYTQRVQQSRTGFQQTADMVGGCQSVINDNSEYDNGSFMHWVMKQPATNVTPAIAKETVGWPAKRELCTEKPADFTIQILRCLYLITLFLACRSTSDLPYSTTHVQLILDIHTALTIY